MTRQFVALIGCMAVAVQIPEVGHTAENTESHWNAVLALASSGQHAGRVELENLAAGDGPVALLAKAMLGKWNDAESTYFADDPIPIRNYCPDTLRLREVFQGTVDPAFALIEIEVTARGVAEAVRLRRTSSNEVFDNLVAEGFKNSRFLPAKPKDNFIPRTLAVMCRMDVD